MFIGRVDDQVKIRGYRVEPGEIGRILEQSEQVGQALVLAKDDKQGNKQLVGYIVPTASYDKQELQAYLRKQVPDYMVPAHMITLDSFPLTANGKIDRRALPDPEGPTTAQYRAPANETEEKLKGIWQGGAGAGRPEHDGRFLRAGGPFTAGRTVNIINPENVRYGAAADRGCMLITRRLARLAERLTTEPSADLLPPGAAGMERPEYIPLSFSQERLWFIDKLEGSAR